MSAYTDLAGLVTFKPLTNPFRHTKIREQSRFSAPWSDTVALLRRELDMIRATQIVMEVGILPNHIRQDGMPRADAKASSPAVVVSFVAKGIKGSPHLVYELDTFDDWQDNVRGLAKGLEAMRLVARYGVRQEGLYAGFKALPAGAGESSMNITEATEFFNSYGVSTTEEGVRALTKRFHPDVNGGDTELWDRLQAAKTALSL